VLKINTYDFYVVGSELHPLTQMKLEISYNDAFFPLWNGKNVINRLLKNEPIELSMCVHAAKSLLTEITGILNRHFLDDKGDLDFNKNWTDLKISPWEIGTVALAAEKFEHVLAEELRAASSYMAPDIGIFKTSALVEEADKNIPDDLLDFVQNPPRTDYRNAGKCLAFGLPTASGFHVLRAVEGVLNDYVPLFIKTDVDKLKTWGDYIDLLNKTDGKAGPKPDKKTLRDLDQLRGLDRNPIMHPREVLDETQARVLFNNCTTAILAMAMEMKKIKGTAQQTVLALPPNDEGEAA
jgi:hypothetical protein